MFYTETESWDPSASVAVVYENANSTFAIHAGKYDMNNGYEAKGMITGVQSYSSEADFQRGLDPDKTLYPGKVRYYKLNK